MKLHENVEKIRIITVWTALKWLGIGILVFYTGRAVVTSALQDFWGIHVNTNISISYNSDGLLRPVSASQK